jgi:hypothetical protein
MVNELFLLAIGGLVRNKEQITTISLIKGTSKNNVSARIRR